MKIDILTLFPEVIKPFLESSMIKRAQEEGYISINLINFRDYSLDKFKRVDDTPYGGGRGMILMIEPLVRALKSIKKEDSLVILMSPQGEKYSQKKAFELSKHKHLIIICGHYEGVDERIKNYIDLELSIGDYILTGGEIPALVLIDTITRLSGILDKEVVEEETFSSDIFDYPVYTRPKEFEGFEVPDVLLSGDHKKIEKWRREEAIRNTNLRRNDDINK